MSLYNIQNAKGIPCIATIRLIRESEAALTATGARARLENASAEIKIRIRVSGVLEDGEQRTRRIPVIIMKNVQDRDM